MLIEQWEQSLRSSGETRIADEAQSFMQRFGNVDTALVRVSHPLLQTPGNTMTLLRLHHPVFAHPPVRALIETSLEDDAPSRAIRGRVPQNWFRDFGVLGKYYSSTISERELADADGVSRQRINQIIALGLSRLHRYSLPQTQEQFDLRQVLALVHKPYYLRLLEIYSPTYPQAPTLAQMLKEGRSVPEIIAELQIPDNFLRGHIKVFRSGGVDIAACLIPAAPSRLKVIREGLSQPDLTDEQTQNFLNQLPDYITNRREPRERLPITTLTKLVRSIGFHFRPDDLSSFVDVLVKSGVPFRLITRLVKIDGKDKMFRYYYIANKDLQRVQEIFEDAPSLARFKENPVRVIGREDRASIIPNTHQLINTGGFTSIRRIFEQLGIRLNTRAGIRCKDFIEDDCAVSVYVIIRKGNRDRYMIPRQSEDEFRAYIEAKYRSLRGKSG